MVQVCLNSRIIQLNYSTGSLLSNVSEIEWQYDTNPNLADLYYDKSLHFPLLRPGADSNPYPAPAYWIADQRPNQLSHSRAQKIGWAEEFLFHSFMVQVCLNSRIIQLNYSTGSLLSNVSEIEWQYDTNPNLADLYYDKSLHFPLLRPGADSNPYPAPAYWIADQRPNQLSHSRAQKIGWAEEFLFHSFMVQVCLNSRIIQLNYSTGSLLSNVSEIEWQYDTNPNLADLYYDKSLHFPLLRPGADSNPYPAPGYWIADQHPNQLSHSRAQKIGWAEEFLFHSFMVQVCLNSRIIQLNYSTGSLLSNVSEIEWQYDTNPNLADLYYDKSLHFPLLRPGADSNPYPAPAYWIADQRPNQLSHSRAQKIGWAEEFLFHSFMVQVCLNSRLIQLNYSTGSLLSNVSEIEWQYDTNPNLADLYYDKSLHFPLLRPGADSNPYFAPAYWIADQRPNQLSHSRAQKIGWAEEFLFHSFMVQVCLNSRLIQLNYSTGSLLSNVSEIEWQYDTNPNLADLYYDKSLHFPLLRPGADSNPYPAYSRIKGDRKDTNIYIYI